MELVAALLVAGPLGYFSPTRVMRLGLYLLVWAVIFPIQTTNVLEPQDTTLDTRTESAISHAGRRDDH
jgi:hypothetical protein